MNNKAFKRFFAYVFIFSIIFFVFAITFSLSKIYGDVKSICKEAKKEFQTDCVSSLIAYSRSGNHSDKEKAKAIWALGQIADRKAIPYLENLITQYECSFSEEYESYICYEVKKAIKWCKKGNLTHYMYQQREEW